MRMGCAYIGFDSEANHNIATKKPLVISDTLKAEIDELRQQVGKIAKLLNAVADKLGVTLEKKNKVIVTQQPSNISEEKEEIEIRVPSQSTTFKSAPTRKRKAYNPELEIKEIKKTLEPILKLLKQVEKQISWDSYTAEQSKSMETDNVIVNVKGLNSSGKAEEVLHWVIEEQFDFVIVMETKLTPTKEKGIFFGSDEYHAFWESNAEKQIGTGVRILVKKCWIHHVETIKGYHGRLLHLGLKFRVPTKKAVAKEIRKLLGDIVHNKEIIIVAGDLNEDLASKSLEETYATNKIKACPTVATLQHLDLVDTHRTYATNNPEKTWASNRVQRRLDYVFTDAVTALLVTNIGVVDVKKSFSTDHRAVVTIIRFDRILAGSKKSRSGRRKSSTIMIDVKKASGMQWKIYAKETNQLTDEAQRKSKEYMDYKLVKIVADIIKQIKINNANMHDNVMDWSNKLTDSKGEQYCRGIVRDCQQDNTAVIILCLNSAIFRINNRYHCAFQLFLYSMNYKSKPIAFQANSNKHKSRRGKDKVCECQQLLAKWKHLKSEVVNAYLMTLPKNKLIAKLLSIKKEYRSTLCARIRLQQQRQIVDNIIKRQQNFDLYKGIMIKSILNKKKQRIILDHVIEESKFHNDPDEIKKLPIGSILDHAFDGMMAEITNEEFEDILNHTPHNKAPGPSDIQAELWKKAGPNTKSKLRTLLNSCIKAANMPEEWRVAQVILIPKPKE
ncbi:hypothetical protein G9A89_016648 [Geosiphon pyriformis]|nr:hypothetical protein G9A89_016648 [Geosiphon pyriformis]